MKLANIAVTVSALALIAACAPSEKDVTLSGYIPVSGGTLDVNDLASRTTRVADGDDGFVVQIIHESNILAGLLTLSIPEVQEINAVAGVIPTTTVSALPNNGSATFTGEYVVRYEDNIVATTSGVIGDSDTESGTITLDADFAAGTLTGSAGGLTIDGNFASTNLDGSVEFQGLTGDLDGLIGGDKAVGVFHGNDDDQVFAGGFLVK